MLKIILDRLKPQAEKIIAEEQAGFKAGRSFETKFLGKLLRIFHMECKTNDWVRNDRFACGPAGTSSGNCQETKSCMVRACHTPWQPLQKKHPSGHLGGWATPLSADEMLDGQHQEWRWSWRIAAVIAVVSVAVVDRWSGGWLKATTCHWWITWQRAMCWARSTSSPSPRDTGPYAVRLPSRYVPPIWTIRNEYSRGRVKTRLRRTFF